MEYVDRQRDCAHGLVCCEPGVADVAVLAFCRFPEVRPAGHEGGEGRDMSWLALTVAQVGYFDPLSRSVRSSHENVNLE